MAAKLGANVVAVRLGNQAVSVYLGAVEVYSPVVTLYFNGASSGDWADLDNWWLDSGHTVAADSLPTAEDNVIATESIESNSGSAPTVSNLTLNDPSGVFTNLAIAVTVTGMATFDGNSATSGTVTGNATFNDSSQNAETVTGNATFNDSSQNTGTVTGNATFNNESQHYGTVTGTATFTGSACNDDGTAGTFVPDPPPSC